MKLLVNESGTTIIVPREDGGVLKLAPKGNSGDRKEVDGKVAASEAVQRFLSAKRVSLLSAEEAAKRAAEEEKREAAKHAAEEKKGGAAEKATSSKSEKKAPEESNAPGESASSDAEPLPKEDGVSGENVEPPSVKSERRTRRKKKSTR